MFFFFIISVFPQKENVFILDFSNPNYKATFWNEETYFCTVKLKNQRLISNIDSVYNQEISEIEAKTGQDINQIALSAVFFRKTLWFLTYPKKPTLLTEGEVKQIKSISLKELFLNYRKYDGRTMAIDTEFKDIGEDLYMVFFDDSVKSWKKQKVAVGHPIAF